MSTDARYLCLQRKTRGLTVKREPYEPFDLYHELYERRDRARLIREGFRLVWDGD